jgi:hypothetical protein
VRASSPCHRAFTLAMGSSPGFGSARRDAPPPLAGGGRAPCSDSPSLRVRASGGADPAAPRNSPAHSSIGTRSAAAPLRRGGGAPLADRGQTVSGTLSLPSPGCFSPFPRGTRALSVARCIQPWTVGGPGSRGAPRTPRYSRTATREALRRRLRGSHPLRPAVPGASPGAGLGDSPRPRQRPP